MPKVSICIPTFNMAMYLHAAVSSALAQTFTDYEVIVCDNASIDETQSVLANFSDPRLRIYRNETNIGMIANFNRVVELASASWIKFLCADDVLEPACIERCVTLVDRHPGVDIVSVGRILTSADRMPYASVIHRQTKVVSGHIVRRRVHWRHNELGNPTTVMVRRTLLFQAGLFDLAYGDYMNDWDLWLRCLDGCNQVGFIAEPLVQVRNHPMQGGAVGAKANIDIDVALMMVCKRWKGVRPLSFFWWQREFLYLVLSAPYFFRSLKQVAHGNLLSGLHRWDGFRRIENYLGLLRFSLLLGFVVLYFPFRTWYESWVSNRKFLPRP
jgi:glycosyltransferase involved in cell wall biosynthesis